MKLKNILVSVSACAIALSAMAMSASAAIKNASPDSENGNDYVVDVKSLDTDNIFGIEAKITFDGKVSADTKGGLAFNADKNKGTGWNQFIWELDASGEVKADGTDKVVKVEKNSDNKYTLTVITDTAYFAGSADWEYANIYIGSWGGTDFTVDSLIPLGKDGKEITAAAAETTAAVETVGATTTSAEAKEDAEGTTSASGTTAAATTSAAKTTAAATTAKKADATKAGDNGVGLAVAGLTLGAAAMFLARKKH